MIHLLRYYFAESGAPWWKAAIWGNIFASIVWGFAAGFVGFFVARKVKAAWARLHHKLDRHADMIEEIHYLAHTGKPHPRAQERIDRGELSLAGALSSSATPPPND